MDKNILKGGNNNLGALDVLKYETKACDKCGHKIFETKYIIKKIPGLVVGAGAEDVDYPVTVFCCAKCGEIMKELREEIEAGEKRAEENKNAKQGGLIL